MPNKRSKKALPQLSEEGDRDLLVFWDRGMIEVVFDTPERVNEIRFDIKGAKGCAVIVDVSLSLDVSCAKALDIATALEYEDGRSGLSTLLRVALSQADFSALPPKEE